MNESISKIVRDIRKTYDFGLPEKTEMISTGVKSIDLLLGGGLPWTCIHEFYGLSKTGKCVGRHTVIFADGWKTIGEVLYPFASKSLDLLEYDKWYGLKKPTLVGSPSGKTTLVNNIYNGGVRRCRAIITHYGNLVATPEHRLGTSAGDLKVGKLIVGDFVEFNVGHRYYGEAECGNLELLAVMTAAAMSGNYNQVEDLIARLLHPASEGSYAYTVLYRYFPREVHSLSKLPKISRAITEFISIIDKLKSIGFTHVTDLPYVIRVAKREVILEFLSYLFLAFRSMNTLRVAENVGKSLVHLRLANTVGVNIFNSLLLNEGLVPIVTVKGKIRRMSLDIDVYNAFARMLSKKLMVSPLNDSIKELYKIFASDNPPVSKRRVRITNIYEDIDEVFDIEIPEGHYYIANGFVSHNSYMMQKALGKAQAKDENVVGIALDRENGYVRCRAMETGIVEERLIYIPAEKIPTIDDCFEKIFELIMQFRSSSKGEKIPLIFIVDSLDSFAVSGTDTGEERGRRAKQFHKGFRTLIPMLSNKIMVLVSNHVTYNPGVMFGNKKTKSGGVAIDNYRDVGIELSNRSKFIEKGMTEGYFIKAHVDKARRVPIHRETMLYLDFKKGIHQLSGYLHVLAKYTDLIKPSNQDTFKKYDKFPMFLYKNIGGNEIKISERHLGKLANFLKENKKELWLSEIQ